LCKFKTQNIFISTVQPYQEVMTFWTKKKWTYMTGDLLKDV